MEAKMDGLKKGVEAKMDGLKKGMEAKMDGFKNGMGDIEELSKSRHGRFDKVDTRNVF